MKKMLLVSILALSIMITGTMPDKVNYSSKINGDYIRFHVLANSDSREDQALKYQIKDVLVKEMETKFTNSQSLEETRNILINNLSEIEKIGQETLIALGSDYQVQAQYGNFSFPTKYYGRNFSLPAGNYEAVRVIIGEGSGANWWCVLFPPMCFVETKVTDSGQNLGREEGNDKQKIQISFKFLEWLEGSFPTLAKIFR